MKSAVVNPADILNPIHPLGSQGCRDIFLKLEQTMRIQLTRAAALVAGTLLFAVPGWAAEIQCGDHQSLTKHLADRFSELLSSTGIDARGRRIELYRSPSGSWTLVLVLEEGPACILSTGSNWEMKDAPRKGLDA
jgi:hypothetical protein